MLTVLASKGGGEHPLSKARVKLLKPQAWQMVGTVDVREAPPASGRGLLPCSEESWGPSQLPRPSCDALTPACLRGRKEVRRAPAAFPFLPCSRLLAPSLLQAPGSFPVSASEEGRQHHGPPRGRHPPDLLLLQRSHRHHCPGHLPCGECAGGPGHCVCVCACEGGPDLWRPLEWEDRCSPPPLGTLDKSLPCSGPWAPSLSKAGEGTLQQWQEWEEGSLF